MLLDVRFHGFDLIGTADQLAGQAFFHLEARRRVCAPTVLHEYLAEGDHERRVCGGQRPRSLPRSRHQGNGR
jgi:hypothetical protein